MENNNFTWDRLLRIFIGNINNKKEIDLCAQVFIKKKMPIVIMYE